MGHAWPVVLLLLILCALIVLDHYLQRHGGRK